MDMPEITAHMVVKNDDRFCWYAVFSVLPFVKLFFITDTGSTDHTYKILSSIKNPKIHLHKKIILSPNDISKIREEMISETHTNWFWVVDADEIYPNSLVAEINSIVNDQKNNLDGIVVRRMDLLGDIYHKQSESVGSYELFGKRGHFALRLINRSNLPGLSVRGMYPMESYYDNRGVELIQRDARRFIFTKEALVHAMYLKRSSSGSILVDTFHRNKYKIELGKRISRDKLPEVFFNTHPKEVDDVTASYGFAYKLLAFLITPLKLIKRMLFS